MEKYFDSFFAFFKDNIWGIFSFFIVIFLIIYFIDRTAFIFGLGKYKLDKNNPLTNQKKGNVLFVLVELLVKIITDFRHFLALILVVIFGTILIYAIYISGCNIDNLSKALQAVMSTLGGLVGSIVGYYFGESKLKIEQNKDSNNELPNPANPQMSNSKLNDITEPELP